MESPRHDPSGVYLSPVLTVQCSETLNLWLKKEHYLPSAENIWHFKHLTSFFETDSYWGSFSRVQPIFILWLSKHLLQVTGWLGELQQIAESHSPPRTHKKAHFGIIKGLRRTLDATSNMRARAVVLYRAKEVFDASFLSPSNHAHIPQTGNDSGEGFRPLCWRQCFIHPTSFCLSST